MNTLKKLIYLLNPSQRKASLVLLVLMFIGMILETLGIGLVIPALSVMMRPKLVEEYPVLAPWLDLLGNPSPTQLITGGVLVLVVIYVIKTMFLVYLSWKQAYFSYGLQKSLSQQLFTGYLRQPYTFHLQRNSAQLIRNATIEIASFTTAVISATTIITETLVLIGIVVLLLLIQPLGATLVIGVMGLASYAFYALTKERILNWGIARQHHEGLRIKHLQQGLGAAKDIKVLGRENNFLSQYATHNKGSIDMGRNQNFLQALPRLWLELLTVLGLAVLVMTMLYQDKSMETLIPTLGLFVAAAFRLMPSANRILSSIQRLRYALPSIDILHEELCLLRQASEPDKNASPLRLQQYLKLENIGYIYPGTDRKVLNDINIKIRCGTTVGFIGASGSGKSTIVDLILGLLEPTDGEVKVDGININSNMQSWQNQIGYVPQTIYLTDDTIRRNIAFGLAEDEIDDRAVWDAIKAAQLDDFIGGLSEGINSVVGERGIKLSGGQLQRIGVARALYHDPAILVLDEATSALDTETEKGVMLAISALQGKKTILIVAHRLTTLNQCDYIYRLEQGEVIQEGLLDKLLDLNSSEKVIRRVK